MANHSKRNWLQAIKPPGPNLTAFGLFNQQISGNDMTVYFDQIKINGRNVDLTKDPGWESQGNHARFKDYGVRPFHNFGYSKTRHAGGQSGEIGGLDVAGRRTQDR